MTKFLIFAAAITAVVVQGQIPKPPKKPDLKNVPKVEVPKLEAPKLDPSKLDPAKLEAPKLEAPKLETPKLEPPKVNPLTLPMPASFNIKEAPASPLRLPLTGSTRELKPPPATVLNERSTLTRK